MSKYVDCVNCNKRFLKSSGWGQNPSVCSRSCSLDIEFPNAIKWPTKEDIWDMRVKEEKDRKKKIKLIAKLLEEVTR